MVTLFMLNINTLRQSSHNVDEFIAKTREILIKNAATEDTEGFLKELQNCAEELYTQNFDIKKFNLCDLDNTESVARIIEAQYKNSDLATSIWYLFHTHQYFLEDPDPTAPQPLFTELQKPLIGSDSDSD